VFIELERKWLRATVMKADREWLELLVYDTDNTPLGTGCYNRHQVMNATEYAEILQLDQLHLQSDCESEHFQSDSEGEDSSDGDLY